MKTFATALATTLALLATSTTSAENWPQWRGPAHNGVAAGNAPTEWSQEENVVWKLPLPELSGATPIVWNDQVFVVTAVETERVDPDLPKPEDQPRRPFGITFPNRYHRFLVISYDRQSGDERWRRVATDWEQLSEAHPLPSVSSLLVLDGFITQAGQPQEDSAHPRLIVR